MRQVNHDELRNILQAGLRRVPVSQIKALQHHEPAHRLRTRLQIAEVLMKDLGRLEILTNAPPPPPFRYPDIGDAPDAPMTEDDQR
jgi:hypothetical protein